MSDSETGSTFRELSAWGSFLIMGSLASWYAVRVIEHPTSVTVAWGLIVMMVLYTVIAHVFLAGFVSLATKGSNEPDDERDRLIESRATRYSEWVLGFGVITTILLVFAQQASWLPVYEIAYDATATPEQVNELPQLIRDIRADTWRHPILSGHALLGTMVLSELVRYLTTALDYRLAS